MNEKLYTISEVADKLNLAPKTLRRWEEAGKFKASRTIGQQRRYSVEDLQILDAIKHGTINNASDLLTTSQAASLFGVSPQTIERWENQGKIHPFITAGNTYYPRNRLMHKMQELQRELKQEQEERTALELEQEMSEEKPPSVALPSQQPKNKLTPLISGTPNRSFPTPALTAPTPTWKQVLFTTTLINATLTILLIGGYHALTIQKPTSPQGEVKGTSQEHSIIDDIIDPLGNLSTPGSITTQGSLEVGQTLTLQPTTSISQTPGTLYYDAATQTLKLFTKGRWYDFPTASTLPTPNDSIIKSGTVVLPKGALQQTVSDPDITDTTHITTTFTADYAPAKKYWITQAEGQFTLHTDFPPGQDSPFTYLLITPQVQEATASGEIQQ